MLSLYRWLLYLYPRLYRYEYADEMVSVFRDAHVDVNAGSVEDRISFRVRETLGLLAGAVREHVRFTTGSYQSISFRGFAVLPEFRFPKSTALLMSIIFAVVILAMEKANTIQVEYDVDSESIWPSLPWFLGGLALLLTCAAAMAGWGILFALRRTGTHHLANIDADPSSAD
jgi:hypothetical protein